MKTLIYDWCSGRRFKVGLEVGNWREVVQDEDKRRSVVMAANTYRE